MRLFGIFFLLLMTTQTYAQKPVPVIPDADIAGDYDDVGAMAMLQNP